MSFSKIILSGLVSVVLSTAAFAGQVSVFLGDETRLPSCGGFVEIKKSPQGNAGEQVNMVFRGVQNCSNFDIVAANGENVTYDKKKIPGPNGDRSGSFTIPKRALERGWNAIKIVVRSDSGAHSDTITLRVKVVETRPAPTRRTSSLTLRLNEEARLQSCGGFVEVRKSPQGNYGEQVNLIFRGLDNCQVFDILSNAGEPIEYSAKMIPNRGGSFTLPKRVIDLGWNSVKIVVRSADRFYEDTVRVQFTALPTPRELPSQPPVSNDTGW